MFIQSLKTERSKKLSKTHNSEENKILKLSYFYYKFNGCIFVSVLNTQKILSYTQFYVINN